MEGQKSPVVLLVPGFFGFNAFGPEDAPQLEYFAGVRAILKRALPAHEVLVHEPPPTGSLEERVASLHEAVRKLRLGEKLPHAPKVTATSLCLVGHSTGGLDARLLANPKFFWTGGPRDAERTDVIDSISKIVTISTPFRGTPLVSHARLWREFLLEGTFALNLLGVFRDGTFDHFALQLLTGSRGLFSPRWLPGQVTSAVLSHAARRAAKKAAKKGNRSDDSELVAQQVQRFMLKIEEDRQLFDDLSVEHMRQVNETIEGGDNFGLIDSYVTVSPKPPMLDVGFDWGPRFVYGQLYGSTARDPLHLAPPEAELLDPATSLVDLVKDQVSCDGVVPTRSQTLRGEAVKIVLGDHLDVVGSYPGGTGADVMRSHSNFTKDRFEKLWTDIAKRILAAKHASREKPTHQVRAN